jgi:hypothetical protein
MNSRLFLNSDASMNLRLFVGGDASFGGNLFVKGDVSMNSRLFLNSDASFNARLFVGGDSTINGNLFANNYNITKLSEQLQPNASTGTPITFNYSTGAVFIMTGTIVANFTSAFTNVPTILNRSHTISIIIPAKFYATAITVNGNACTLYFNGGGSAISISGSTSIVVQTIVIVNNNSSAAAYAISTVSQYYA